jgi:hypothetical protein
MRQNEKISIFEIISILTNLTEALHFAVGLRVNLEVLKAPFILKVTLPVGDRVESDIVVSIQNRWRNQDVIHIVEVKIVYITTNRQLVWSMNDESIVRTLSIIIKLDHFNFQVLQLASGRRPGIW